MTIITPQDQRFQHEIQRAINFANKAHKGQTRKGNFLPYIVHPIAVLNQIADWECYDLIVWKAAVCHDIDEDTAYNMDDITRVIGEEAASIVDELTFRPTTGDPHEKAIEKKKYMKMWGEKDENGLWLKSLQSLIIKASDRMMNTLDFLNTDPQYASKYWNKASDLMDAVSTRSEEIIEVYGDNVWSRMRYSQTCIIQHLY